MYPGQRLQQRGDQRPERGRLRLLELQFYPPGYGPFIDPASCDTTHWCAALTIDSLESQFNFANLNPNCEEPVNFAFLQRNGVPAGPPARNYRPEHVHAEQPDAADDPGDVFPHIQDTKTAPTSVPT